MLTGQVRARYVPGETPFLDEVTRASPGYESTWKSRPGQEKPSNKRLRRNVFPAMDLGGFMDELIGHLDGWFRTALGVRFWA